jgi:hypothetical protein
MHIYNININSVERIRINKRLLHDIFHIDPGNSPRLPYQARQRSWRADMGRGLISDFKNIQNNVDLYNDVKNCFCFIIQY